MPDDTVELTIEGPDGTDDLTLPSRLLELLAEDEDSYAEVVGDIAVFGCAQRIHGTVHHGDEIDPELEALDERMMDLFEDRFDASFAELTGHQH